jgi:uncharacterized protein DUF5681
MSLKHNKKKKPTNGRWARGTSGNPAGRPVGSRNRSSVFYEQLLNGQGEALFQKAIELALAGDATALRLCLERISPPRKERTIDLPLPKVTDPQSVSAALASVMTAVGKGRITPGEAESLAGVLESQMRVVEVEDLARRVAELEKSPGSQAVEPLDRATLNWISRNYSNQTPGSGRTAEPHPEHRTGHQTDAEEAPPPAPGTSTTPSETTR